MKETLFDDGGGKNVVALGHGWLCSLFANRGMQRIVASLLLLTVLASLCPALVSTNVPLDHWSYAAVDKLADYALIDSAMLNTRPISRIEMARHIGQAMHRLEKEKDPPAVLLSILDRLQKEFEGELILIDVLEGSSAGTYVKPVEDPYVKYLYASAGPTSRMSGAMCSVADRTTGPASPHAGRSSTSSPSTFIPSTSTRPRKMPTSI